MNMKKLGIILVVFIIGALTGAAISFLYLKYFVDKEEEEPVVITSEVLELDEKKVSTHLSKVLDTKGAYWQRMFEIYWNEVEEVEGTFDWSFVDERIREFNELEIYPLVIIKPFANWDQDACHGEEYEAEFDPRKGGNVKVGKPCDMEAYKNFLAKAVERYDGDGENDMPGIEIPVKYWEVMNEPSMQGGSTGGLGEELKFFVGTSEEYLEILKASFEVIKATDPEAKVVQGGMAGMQQGFLDFWEPIFDSGGGDYFDIANMHSINTGSRREDMFMIKFKRFLERYGLEDKPIWITEVQSGSLTEEPEDIESFEVLMVKSTVFSLALGADKLFYVENWTRWGNDDEWEKEIDPKDVRESSTQKVYLNLIEKVNLFDEVVTVKEDYIEYEHDSEGAYSEVGQYKFVDGDDVVYVLWGEAEIPSEISGQVEVADIYGESETMDASELVLTDEPVFVELL